MNLILCGLPLCGKTFYGKQVAEKTCCIFWDLDTLIEKKEEKRVSCREIFLKKGEEAFRLREKGALLDLKEKTPGIIALGGGTLMKEENISLVREMGFLVYLETPLEMLLKRLKNKKEVPAYLNPQEVQASYEALARKRLGIYEKNAHMIINTQKFSEKEILCQLIEKRSSLYGQ